jgi:hypothetical protein
MLAVPSFALSPAGGTWEKQVTVYFTDTVQEAGRNDTAPPPRYPLPNAEYELSTSDTTLAHGSIDTKGVLALDLRQPPDEATLRVWTHSESVSVSTVDSDEPYSMTVPFAPDLSEIILDGDATTSSALMVFTMLSSAAQKVRKLNGAPPPLVHAVFPTDRSTSSWNPNQDGRLHLLEGDGQDWDVVLHEYGHFLGSALNLGPAVTGRHRFTENLANRKGVADGMALAWSEAWPTVLSIALQRAISIEPMPAYFGDTAYTDSVDVSPPVSYDLESNAGMAGTGVDNELAVQRAVWDLLDPAEDEGDDRGIGIGIARFWSLLKGAHPADFAHFWRALTAGAIDDTSLDMGCILAEQGISPRLSAADVLTEPDLTQPPAISWSPQGGAVGTADPAGYSTVNDEFRVLVMGGKIEEPLADSLSLSGDSWQPSQDEWARVLDSGDGDIRIVVLGGHHAPTGETVLYPGCPVNLGSIRHGR